MSWVATGRYRIRVAPNGLAVAQEVLNTRAVGTYGGDLLADEAAGAVWLRTAVRTWAGQEGVDAPDAVPDAADLAVVRAVRDRLVEMIMSRGGTPRTEPPSPRHAAADLVVGADDVVRLTPAGAPGEWLESAVWAQVLLAQRDGTWPRLKLCREPACASAFYDMSRNNSGVWHDVRVCGNAANLRASRLRRKQLARKERHMKAIIDGAVVAEAPESDLISIEGNYYFPPSSIRADVISDSPTPYTCPWKGVAQYHDIAVHGSTHHDAAWSYPDPYPASFGRVGEDYSAYVAFDKKQVTITD